MADGFATFVPGRRDDDTLEVRALFLSDLHLGTRACQADRLLDLLEHCRADQLYLVGDVVDGWRLKARWYWPPSHDAIVRCLLRKQQEGTRIRYIPGNHDEFLRHSIGLQLGGIEVVSEAVHAGLDGRRYLVVHGDGFDPMIRHMRRLAAMGTWAYAAGVLLHDTLLRHRRRPAAAVAAFEHALAREARRKGMDGVICGHIHQPALNDRLGVRYANTGDWVDACTAVVEQHDGALTLLHWRHGTPRAARAVAVLEA